MALRDDFEAIRGRILHNTPLQTVDSVIDELLEEEIRLKSRSHFHSENGIVEKEILPTSDSS